MSLFKTGKVMMTSGIANIASEERGMEIVLECLQRHCSGDWGDLSKDDKKLNKTSLDEEKKYGHTGIRLFSAYETDVGTIYIITECDRSVTTILLPEEYRRQQEESK